jgi:hypothetical protein
MNAGLAEIHQWEEKTFDLVRFDVAQFSFGTDGKFDETLLSLFG